MPKKTGKLADVVFGEPSQAAFGVFPQMKPRRSQQDPEAAKNVPIDVARGFVSGVLGAPGDIESLIRLLPGLDEKTVLPTSEDIEKRIPLKSDTPVSRAATGLGQLGGGFYMGPGSPLRMAAGLPGAVVKAGKDFAIAAGASGPRIFIGPKAKTWDQAKADAAVRLEKTGTDPIEIWKQTGTFRGVDGILRQEIDDSAAQFLTPDERKEMAQAIKSGIDVLKDKIKTTPQKDLFPKQLTEAKKDVRERIAGAKEELADFKKDPNYGGAPAHTVFSHPELYKAYPELARVPIETGGYGGNGTKGALSIIPREGDRPGSMSMDIYDRGLMSNPTSTSLHEMQHAVQTLEGMSPGGNQAMAFKDPRAFEILKRKREEIAKPMTLDEYRREAYGREVPDPARLEKSYKEYLDSYKIGPEIDRQLQQAAAQEYYLRLAGEAEARAVQDRQMLTPQQRRETPPAASFDYPQEDLLTNPPREYKKGGKVEFASNPDAMRLELEKGGAAFGVFPQMKPRRGGRSDVDPNVAIPRGLARGFVSGAAGAGGDLEQLARILANTPGPQIFGEATASMMPGKYKTGEVGMKTRLPTSEDVEKVVPFRPENPSAMEQVATGAGQIAGGFYTGPGAPIRAVTAIPEAVGKAARDFALAAGKPAVNVIKPPRGNWVGGDSMRNIENHISVLLPTSDALDDIAIQKAFVQKLKDSNAPAEEIAAAEHNLGTFVKDQAVNDWVRSNLKNYVKRQMATPEDPVRKLAEEGVTHLPPDTVERMRNNVDPAMVRERVAAGFPAEGMGQSDVAKAWETMADEAIQTHRAGRIQQVMQDFPEVQAAEQALKEKQREIGRRFDEKLKEQKSLTPEMIEAMNQKTPISEKAAILGDKELEELNYRYNEQRRKISAADYGIGKDNPWIEKLSPDTPIYAAGVSDLGFDHIIDVLRQDVASGRIRPDQLNKVSMEQAVRRTAEYDAELAAKMNAERAAAREGLPVYKEYPEGYRWIELNRPGAFSAESEAMGHSVRGYEPPPGHPDWASTSGDMGSLGYGHGGWEGIKSGKAKIYSLVDPKGEPHVTVEVASSRMHGMSPSEFYQSREVPQSLLNKIDEAEKAGDLNDIGSLDLLVEYSPEYKAYRESLPSVQNITQVRGKQNMAPKEEYLPYVQDFVRSGQWSSVGDQKNIGMRNIGSVFNQAEIDKIKELGGEIPPHGFMTGEEIQKLHNMIVPEGKRLKYDARGNIIGSEDSANYESGGSVSFTDNPDAMRLELAGGGLVKALKAATKAAKTEAQVAKEAPSIIVPGKISNVMEEVRQSKGDYGAKRVQRAADEIKNLEKMYKEEALRSAFTGDNAQAMMTMNPADFEKFALKLVPSKGARMPMVGEPDKYNLPTDEYVQYLQKLREGFDDVPFLGINKDEQGLPILPFISGHEGRHRSRALAASGQPASLVRLVPRAELREPFPRRSQEEYIEALRKELELTDKMVLPEGDLGAYRSGEGPPPRPAIELPDVYAEGGAVEMQAGGLARLFGGGAKAAKSAEKAAAVPLDLPRVRPTKQDIIEAAERVGKQQAGEHVTSPLLGKTENLAGRSKKEAERVKALRYDVQPTKKLPPLQAYKPKIGEVNIALPGDQTISDAILVSVDDIPVGSTQEGGALFGRGRLQDPENKRAFWASNVGPAQIFQNKVTDIAQKYDTDMVTAYHLAMGTDANNFAQHFADANLRAIDYSKLSKRDMETFDRAIADGYVKKNPKTGEYVHTAFPEWPGVANPEASYQAMKENPELRKWFNNRMKTEKLTRATNMPDGRSIEWAITEPAIRNMEINMTGLSAGRMKPGAELIPESAHQTYSHDIPGTALGQAEELAPFSISFPDVTDFVRKKYRPQDFTGTIQKVFPHQVVDEAYLEDMYNYYTQLRKVRGFQEGGAVKKAGGGDISAEDLTIEERPL